MADVLIRDVTKVYPGDVLAVEGMNLDIKNEEFVVFVGPSGCGKTTTLRMVAGLEEITSGTITIGEQVVNEIPPKNRDIAMVFQNYALYPHMSVYKNMAFGLKLRKYPKDEIRNRVSEAAKILGISELLDRKPKALSGGQRQRVAVGRAIVRQPKAFLFDEPLSNLDAKLRVEMRAELKKLHRTLQTTTIYVTHDQEEAMTLGDRVVVMKDGVVQQCGKSLTIYDRPVNRFVAGFVGTPPMNFIDGTITYDNGGVYFDEGTGNKMRMPDEWKDRLGEFKDQQMVMGIRPENMFPKPEGRFAGKENSMKFKVDVIEPLGDKMDINMNTDKHSKIVARIDARQDMEEQQTVDMYTDVSRLHIFKPGETGENITLRDGNDA